MPSKKKNATPPTLPEGNRETAVCSFSGGMDSATVLLWLLEQGFKRVVAFQFVYGSKHNKHERRAATVFHGNMVARYPNQRIELRMLDLSAAFNGIQSNLMQTGGDIPEGHYTDASMSATVVPGRNMIFISLLAGHAWSLGAEIVALGVHQGDHAIYEDCREVFVEQMAEAVKLGTGDRVRLVAPFLSTDKEGILRYGVEKNLPYQHTRTCYKDQALSCGKCGSCVERLEAFSNIGETDPVNYVEQPTETAPASEEQSSDKDDK